MWHKRSEYPVMPELHDGDRIKLRLDFRPYFGHTIPVGYYTVWAVWDELNEEFYEIESKRYIHDEDIEAWWEEDKK